MMLSSSRFVMVLLSASSVLFVYVAVALGRPSIWSCTLLVTVPRYWNSVLVTEPSASFVASIPAPALMLSFSRFVMVLLSASMVLFVYVAVSLGMSSSWSCTALVTPDT